MIRCHGRYLIITNCSYFSTCACHPWAGAVPIFSVPPQSPMSTDGPRREPDVFIHDHRCSHVFLSMLDFIVLEISCTCCEQAMSDKLSSRYVGCRFSSEHVEKQVSEALINFLEGGSRKADPAITSLCIRLGVTLEVTAKPLSSYFKVPP